MSYEQQQKEIKTIRERNITVKLSNVDCEKLIKKCGKFGLTPGELIENFISDLIDGTYSNGSDERYLVNQWFDYRFSHEPQDTLLQHLLFLGYDPKNYLDVLEEIQTAKAKKEYLKDHPEDADEESIFIEEDIAYFEDELKYMRTGWKPKELKIDEEIELIEKWINDKDAFIY